MTKQDEILNQVMKGTYSIGNYTYSSLKAIAKKGIEAGKQQALSIALKEIDKWCCKGCVKEKECNFEKSCYEKGRCEELKSRLEKALNCPHADTKPKKSNDFSSEAGTAFGDGAKTDEDSRKGRMKDDGHSLDFETLEKNRKAKETKC